jgi:hypothetical protein
MREVASKAATGESTAGLLKIMDDIAGLRGPRSLPPIAAGGYRVLDVRRDRPRPSRAAALAPLTGRPMRMRGFLTALFAGGLGLAVLAGPATCPTCDPGHADGQLDAKRILSRLTYTPGEAVELAAREAPPLDRPDVPAVAERGMPPALSELALVEPQNTASSNAPISTAAIDPAPERVPDTAPATATQPAPRAAKLPEKIEQLSDQGPPQTEIAAATVESEPEPPLSPVGSTTLPLKDVAVDPEEPAPRVQAPRKHIPIKARDAKPRAKGSRNAAPSAPRLYSPNKYAQVPGWAAKMFETPWQTKAFSFQ